MSKKRRSVFIMLLTVGLIIVMAVPVGATTYKQKYKASQKIFNSIYYGRYSNSYKFGSEVPCVSYDLDLNKDGYPEHIEYYSEVYDYSETGRLLIVYTSYKNTVRRYVFKDVKSIIYRSGKYIAFEKMDGKYKGHNRYTYKVYRIQKGKLQLVNKKFSSVTYVGYFKNGKRCSYDTYYSGVSKITRYALKSSNYWGKLFNATRNFG